MRIGHSHRASATGVPTMMNYNFKQPLMSKLNCTNLEKWWNKVQNMMKEITNKLLEVLDLENERK